MTSFCKTYTYVFIFMILHLYYVCMCLFIQTHIYMGYVHECVFLGVYLVETERFESLCRKLLGTFISGIFALFYFIHKINKSNQ